MDVRKLAAIDMHGLFGTRRRWRVILAEFAFGAVVMVGAGAVIIAGHSTLATEARCRAPAGKGPYRGASS